MAVYRIPASKNTSIFQYFSSSNAGQSEILSVGATKLYSRTRSVTQSGSINRVLIKFDEPKSNTTLPTITGLIASGTISSSNDVSGTLKIYHAYSENYAYPNNNYEIHPMQTISWDEGFGKDIDNGDDTGSTNWSASSAQNTWTSAGGDYITSQSFGFTASEGDEDISVNVTNWVRDVLNTTSQNQGFMLKTQDENALTNIRSHKLLYSRHTNTPYQPVVEIYWDDRIRDDRSNLLNYEADNRLYLYNKIRKDSKDISGLGKSDDVMLVRLISYPSHDSASVNSGAISDVSASWLRTGIYRSDNIDVGTSVNSESIYDFWFSGSSIYGAGTCSLKTKDWDDWTSPSNDFYVLTQPNIQSSYLKRDVIDIEVFARKRYPDYVYGTSSMSELKTQLLYSASYAVYDYQTEEALIDFGDYTALSYNQDKNWFTMYMSAFPVNRELFWKVKYKNNGQEIIERLPITFNVREKD